MKTCSKCGAERPLDQFYIRNGKPAARCKPCVQVERAAYRTANPDRARESNRRSHQRHRDERLAAHRQWREANPDKVRDLRRLRRDADAALMREWRRNNPDAARAAAAKWRAKNPGWVREYQREWKQRNPGRSARNLREWRKRNPDRHLAIVHARRAAKRQLSWGDVTAAGVDRLIEAFGGLCAYCMTAPATDLDHYMPLKLGGLHALDNLMPACRSCNCSKGAKHPDEWLNRERIA